MAPLIVPITRSSFNKRHSSQAPMRFLKKTSSKNEDFSRFLSKELLEKEASSKSSSFDDYSWTMCYVGEEKVLNNNHTSSQISNVFDIQFPYTLGTQFDVSA